jgi:hypothetical protein
VVCLQDVMLPSVLSVVKALLRRILGDPSLVECVLRLQVVVLAMDGPLPL